MRTSEDIKDIAVALSTFQAECPNVIKSAVNPFFKKNYATLDAIWDMVRPVLNKHGLSIVQGGGYVESTVVTVTTRLVHTSGQWFESDYHLPGGDGNKYTPQSVGSAITYGRRYGLSAMLGIASEEDTDGNGQSHKVESRPSQKVESRPMPPPTEKPSHTVEELIAKCNDGVKWLVDNGKFDQEQAKVTLAAIDRNKADRDKLTALFHNLAAAAKEAQTEQKEIF